MWLAARGITYHGVDVSPVAVDLARDLAERHGLAARCRFEVFDLDEGLSPGEPVDLILSYLFFDYRLAGSMIERLQPGGLLAIATLSEVGSGPGPHRAAPGELIRLFGTLDRLAGDEADGYAWLIGQKPSARSSVSPA